MLKSQNQEEIKKVNNILVSINFIYNNKEDNNIKYNCLYYYRYY